jgi:hypothetical protein
MERLILMERGHPYPKDREKIAIEPQHDAV